MTQMSKEQDICHEGGGDQTDRQHPVAFVFIGQQKYNLFLRQGLSV